MAKEIDSLMEYLRNHHNISINGISEKQELRNIGYYHGYKGYRYINNPDNRIKYNTFEELLNVYNFDMYLKSLLYTKIMFIETALKNYVLEILLKEAKSENFTDIYERLLNDHKQYEMLKNTCKNEKERRRNEEKYKGAVIKRMELRDRIFKVETRAYSQKNKIAMHFFQKGVSLPIWAIFELITLSEFASFISCLNSDIRRMISKSLGINELNDSDGMLTKKLIYTIKDLRNGIAHNEVIFDVRFQNKNVDKSVIDAVSNVTGISNITFITITDYIILMVYMLKFFKVSKQELYDFIEGFQKLAENLKQNISSKIYEKIIHKDMGKKFNILRKFIEEE